MTLTGGKTTTAKETCPIATPHTMHSTCTDTGSNPVLLGERPATNRLSQGTASYLPFATPSYTQPTIHSPIHQVHPSIHSRPPFPHPASTHSVHIIVSRSKCNLKLRLLCHSSL